MKRICGDIKFYYCSHCGKIIAIVKGSGTPTVCCGDTMTELVPCTEDASHEKHVPVIKKNKCSVVVSVGESLHPMSQEHYIEWIMLVTCKGTYSKCLTPEDKPVAEFILQPFEEIICAYAFCNIHKLWKSC